MKSLKQTLFILVAGISFTSCGSLINNNAMMSVQKGMSQEEVSHLLGKPDYRRFDEQGEQWEYKKGGGINHYPSIILVDFTNGKVTNFDSFEDIPHTPPIAVCPPNEIVTIDPPHNSGHIGKRRPMNADDFERLYNKVKNKPFKDDQIEIIAVGSINNYFTSNQCARLMKLFTWDDEKMKILDILAPRIVDKENAKIIIDTLDSLFKKDDAEKKLGISKQW